MIPFSVSIASSHDFHVWPENLKPPAFGGLPSETLHPSLGAEENALDARPPRSTSCLIIELVRFSHYRIHISFAPSPHRAPFSSVMVLPLACCHRPLMRSPCAEKLGCNNALLGLLQKKQDQAEFAGYHFRIQDSGTAYSETEHSWACCERNVRGDRAGDVGT